MKKISLFLIVIAIIGIGSNISCESDDICAESTATTPSLIIDLYDVENPENIKAITRIAIGGIDNDFLLTNGIVSLSKIILPLKTDANSTSFALIKDAVVNNNNTPADSSDDFLEGNQDIITINYTRSDVYVSRACGYKTIFQNVTLSIAADTDNWIKSRQPLIDNQTVEDETQTHYNLFH